MQELIDKIWNFVDVNAGKMGLALSIILAIAGYIKYKKDNKEKDLEVMPEFEIKSLGYSTNGRKFRLINKSKIMVRVLEIKTKTPELIDFSGSTTLNWYLEENENNFYVQVRNRTGNVKFSLIFENKLRREYIQTVTFVSGSQPTVNDKYSISRANRY